MCIRILYVVSSLKQSGPTNQLKGIIDGLDLKLYQPIILTLSPNRENTEVYKFGNVQVVQLNMNRLNYMLNGKRKLKTALNEIQPDLIHTQGFRSDCSVYQINKNKIPHCCTIRNFVFDDYNKEYGKLLGSIMALQHLRILNRIENVVCCSSTLGKMYGKLLKNSSHVIKNGVEINQYFALNNDDKKKLKHKLGFNNEYLICSIGILNERKDPECVIRGFVKSNMGDDVKLIIIGKGKLDERCKKIATQNVILKGHINNVYEYLQISDCFVSASHSEGLPNSVLEAASVGINLILSDIPQHREIFEDSIYKNVSFFPCGDDKKLSHILKRYYNHPSSYSNQLFCDAFSSKNMSKQYQSLYLKIIRG